MEPWQLQLLLMGGRLPDPSVFFQTPQFQAQLQSRFQHYMAHEEANRAQFFRQEAAQTLRSMQAEQQHQQDEAIRRGNSR
jgi:hypothetical protein